MTQMACNRLIYSSRQNCATTYIHLYKYGDEKDWRQSSMMYVTVLFKRVEHITKEWVKSVSSMTPRNKKEYSNDLPELVIKHFLNGNSKPEIAQKVLIPRDSVHYIIAKYKSTKSIGNLKGRGRRRKTSTNTDHILQQKVKTSRRKSVVSVKAELENEQKLIISEWMGPSSIGWSRTIWMWCS